MHWTFLAVADAAAVPAAVDTTLSLVRRARGGAKGPRGLHALELTFVYMCMNGTNLDNHLPFPCQLPDCGPI